MFRRSGTGFTKSQRKRGERADCLIATQSRGKSLVIPRHLCGMFVSGKRRRLPAFEV